MKRFCFALDRIRRFRSEQAELEELKLQQLRGRLAELDGQRRRVAIERERSDQSVLEQPSIEARELQSLGAYRRHLGNQVRDLETHQRQCENQVREQRLRLIEARQKVELLERLKQKALAEWSRAGDREEEALATELFLAKRARHA